MRQSRQCHSSTTVSELDTPMPLIEGQKGVCMSRTAFYTAICSLVMPIGTTVAWPAAPAVYTQPTYESPVRGDPDDLLLIPGYGLAANDTVVYESVADTAHPPAHPASVPSTSNATLGV